MEAYAVSNIGNVRENHEDNLFVPLKNFITSDKQKEIKSNSNQVEFDYSGQNGVFVVSDGMGGHNAGEVASRIAVEKVCEKYDSLLTSNKEDLLKFVKDLNEYICVESDKVPDYSNMGTTFSGLIINEGKVSLLQVGDSRIYKFADGVLKQLSRDHTEGNRLLESGVIKKEDLEKFPNRKSLYKYMGRKVDLVADYETFDIKPGDKFIISSDGLTDTLGDGDILETFKNNQSPKEVCEDLVNKCLARGDRCSDNVTIICIKNE